MTTIVQWFLLAALGVSADPIDARYLPFLQEGCFDGPPTPTMESGQGIRSDQLLRLADLPMSGNSLRFFITPDSYRGDGLLMVQIDSGLRRSLGANGQPFVLATVGNWERTCTVRMPLDACPQAAEVREQLKQLQIPVGYGLDSLDRITLHATSYSMQFSGDGVNGLSYHTPGNPLEGPLEQAKTKLRACWGPAFDAAADRQPTE